MSTRNFAVTVSLVFLFAAGALSRRFPPVNTDEAFIAVHGFNLLSGEGQRYSLYDGIFAPEVYSLRDAFGQVSLTFYNAWVGLWCKIFTPTYQHVRWSSVCAGGIVLIIFFLLGSHFAGPALGAIATTILVIDPVFVTASCLIRPEIVLLASSSALLLFYLKVNPAFRWKSFLLGTLAGLQAGVHPNAMVFWVGLILFTAIIEKPDQRLRHLIHLMLGLGAGVILAFGPVNLPKYVMGYKLMLYDLYKPPLISFPWRPDQWLYGTAMAYATGSTAYLTQHLIPLWQPGMECHAVGILLCLILAVSQDESKSKGQPTSWRIAATWGLVATFAGAAALVRRKELIYSLVLYPFLIPLVGSVFVRTQKNGRFPLTFLCKFGSVLFFLCSFGSYLSCIRTYSALCKPLDQVALEAKAIIQNSQDKIAGPDVFWFELNHDNFRDIGALMYSRWYTGGRTDYDEWLGQWKPQIVIFDSPLEHLLFGRGFQMDKLGSFLKTPATYLGSVDTGPGAYGVLDIVRLHWDPS